MNCNNDYIRFNCIELTQPIGNFYIGSLPFHDLLTISYSDKRKAEQDSIENYIGIQRPLSESRVKEIGKYVNSFDATFPTAIILSISSDNICNFDGTRMEIKNSPNVAKIIDGQHRVEGLKLYNGNVFDINVTIFIDMDLSDQANVFSTINLNQAKVNKSLAYDLYEYSNKRSPEKTCHDIVKLLNTTEHSPFYHKIKILGTANKFTDNKHISDNCIPTLTQAAIVDGILQYIYVDSTREKSNSFLTKFSSTIKNLDQKKYIFHQFYIDNEDAKIAKILWNYFSSLKNKWPDAWNNNTGLILNKTAGFNTLMKFLKDIYLHYNKIGHVLSIDDFNNILDRINLKDDDFSITNYPSNSVGASALYKKLKELSKI